MRCRDCRSPRLCLSCTCSTRRRWCHSPCRCWTGARAWYHNLKVEYRQGICASDNPGIIIPSLYTTIRIQCTSNIGQIVGIPCLFEVIILVVSDNLSFRLVTIHRILDLYSVNIATVVKTANDSSSLRMFYNTRSVCIGNIDISITFWFVLRRISCFYTCNSSCVLAINVTSCIASIIST